MENLFSSIVLGIVQGASEFLPISSSGHLVIVPYLFGLEDQGLAFDVALHFGTLIAVIAYFWKDWVEILTLAYLKFRDSAKLNIKNKDYLRISKYGFKAETLWILAVATIPGVFAGFFLQEIVETVFRNPLIVAFNLFFWGLVLYLTDVYSSKIRSTKDISFLDGIIIGTAQAIAIIPGTSRSGITITTGLVRGLDRKSAARFSFLMLTPIALGASLLKISELIAEFDLSLLMGIILSAISGFIAIKYLLKFVEKASYKIFFWYRFVVALLIVAFVVFGK